MKTNDLKKGTRIKLRNGWEAEIVDKAKGNIRSAKVFGTYTEIGSVYSHDIVQAQVETGGISTPKRLEWVAVEHTPAQIKLRQQVAAFGF